MVTNPMELCLWEPLTIGEVVPLFAAMPAPWWIAGGWAIDLFVDSQTRPHHDIDVGVLRRDQVVVQATLDHWDLWAAEPRLPLRKWRPGESLGPGIHDIWCRRSPATAASFVDRPSRGWVQT